MLKDFCVPTYTSFWLKYERNGIIIILSFTQPTLALVKGTSPRLPPELTLNKVLLSGTFSVFALIFLATNYLLYLLLVEI